MSEKSSADLTKRIADRLRGLRSERGYTLEELAQLSGVSRSMISAIERAENSPTALLLERLAAQLGVSLAALFDAPAAAGDPVARRADQAEWRDPSSGYLRRSVSPTGVETPIRLVEVEFPAGGRVTYDTGARAARIDQQVWVLDGVLDVTVGDETHHLEAGDCLAFQLDRPTGFHNPSAQPVRYAVIVVGEGGPTR